MSDDHEQSYSETNTALLIVVLLVSFAVAAVAFAQQVQGFGPRVGDIITFQAGGQAPADLRQEVRAFVDGPQRRGEACVLRLQTLMESGSSLVVEAIDPKSQQPYGIHLAGGRNSNDPAACAGNARLFVSQDAVVTLATAAGGIGVGETKQTAGLLPTTGPAYAQ